MAAALAAALAVCILLICLRTDKKTEEAQLTTEEDILEQYVGPLDCEDRGEWFDPREYYSLFDEDGRPGADFNAALFSAEEKKGIVPAGVILEPAFLCYDDFEPFLYLEGYGYVDAYSCAALPQSAELQLGVSADFSLSGSYVTSGTADSGGSTDGAASGGTNAASVPTAPAKDSAAYSGSARVDITGMEYYITNTFDMERFDTDGSEYADANGPYLKAHLAFDYKGSFRATRDDGSGPQLIQSDFEGRFDDGRWSFDSDFSGQGSDIFPTGETYLRCRIPCTETRIDGGSRSVTDSFVNVYFRVSEIRVGTRADVRPLHEEAEQE